MSWTGRWTIRFLIGLSLITTLGSAGALGTRAWAQARNADDLAITVPPGVQEETFVTLGGVEQWVTVRGRDRRNPVLLVVGGNGGPTGSSMTPLARTFMPWERDFTLVQWDHRGAGRTFVHNGKRVGPELTFDRLTTDGLQLVEHLQRRLGVRKVVLLGLDYGSTVAVKMIKARPELFSVYVAAGQVTSTTGARERFFFERNLRLATAAGDTEGVAALTAAGPPPHADPELGKAAQAVAARYRPPNPKNQIQEILAAPHWSLEDISSIPAAGVASDKRLWPEWRRFDFRTLEGRIAVPVVMIMGEDNDIDPTPHAKAWLDRINAPKKVFAAIPVAGNHAPETHTLEFLDRLNRHVRPLALEH
jgi:pimeloyl-ACP methyl ester carboxylesterase